MNITVKGHVQIRTTDGEILAERDNLVVTNARVLLAAATAGNSGYQVISYCAIGTGTTTPAITNVTLTSEVSRQPTSLSGASGVTATIQTLFPAALSSFSIKELGLFGGAATSVSGSGLMFSHTLLTYNNASGPKDLIITWTISYS
jgi:hypothetical protein